MAMHVNRGRRGAQAGGERAADRASSVREQTTSVAATEAQNAFGRIMAAAMGGTDVVITSHNAPRAVLVSVQRYEELTKGASHQLDVLSDQFDALLVRMQEPAVRAATLRGFHASEEELAAAAIVERPKGAARPSGRRK